MLIVSLPHMMKKVAQNIVAIYLALGELSFLVSIKFGILGIFVLAYNANQYLSGETPTISLPVALLVGLYTTITTLPWISGIYLKINESSERTRKEKDPQFIGRIQQKIRENKSVNSHEEELITKDILVRLDRGEMVGIEDEAFVVLSDSNRFEYFLFRYDDERFVRLFEYFAQSLDDEAIKLIFSKTPTRIKKYRERNNE